MELFFFSEREREVIIFGLKTGLGLKDWKFLIVLFLCFVLSPLDKFKYTCKLWIFLFTYKLVAYSSITDGKSEKQIRKSEN